ncbi:hypothetical protein QTG56_25040 (plasmid) [Rossellomorea sp. AcN35-11]|nr:hypothetical protein [Rossellomorea aquimaris]WJV31900.1 hypothetical protein QTG56_25040 [Rossellomorea sp. AcN35-11]
MLKLIEKYPHQFEEFMNVELFHKINSLGEGENEAILLFSQEHQIEYVGELAERWSERKIINNEKDLVAMNLALSFTPSRAEFLYNQKELYVERVREYIKKHKLSESALVTLMKFMSVHRIDYNEVLEELIQHKKQTKAFEHIHNIYLLTLVYNYRREEYDNLFNLICQYIDSMELCLQNPFEDYTQLYLMSRTFLRLHKPKAKSFKTKGRSRLLQTIGNLRWKEVEWSNTETYTSLLNISKKDAITYNYILSGFKCYRDQKITGPGFERIYENLLRAHYTSKEEFPNELVDEVTELNCFHKSEEYGAYSPFEKMLAYRLNEVPDHNVIHLLNHATDKEIIKRISPKYIRFLKSELLDETKQKTIVDKLLAHHSSKVTKDEFYYLEERREKLGLQLQFVTQGYVDTLIAYGFIKLEDIELLKSKGYLTNAIEHVRENKSTGEYLLYLDQLEPSYYSNLKRLDELTSEEPDTEIKKLYYKLKLQDVFGNRPTQYADMLFDFLQDEEYLSLFEYTESEVEELEKSLYEHKMLSETKHKLLHKKLTPKEVLEAEYIKKAKEKINKTLQERYSYLYIDDLITMCLRLPTLIDTLIDGLLDVKIIDQSSRVSNLGDFLLMVYKTKTHFNLTDKQLTDLENKAINHITITKLEEKSA